MSVQAPMTITERRKRLRQMQKRYETAERTGRNRLPDDIETVAALPARA